MPYATRIIATCLGLMAIAGIMAAASYPRGARGEVPMVDKPVNTMPAQIAADGLSPWHDYAPNPIDETAPFIDPDDIYLPMVVTENATPPEALGTALVVCEPGGRFVTSEEVGVAADGAPTMLFREDVFFGGSCNDSAGQPELDFLPVETLRF